MVASRSPPPAFSRFGVAACGDDDDDDSGDSGSGEAVSGTIRIDGSSTVGPLTSAIAEGFNEENPDVDVTVGTSGTGGGFEKFCAGETDANDASEAIGDEEIAACEAGGVKYEEIQVANDALTVVVNPENPVTCMTVDQLKSVWEPKSTISSWSDIQGLDPPVRRVAGALRARVGLGHVRLLHRGDQR